MKKPDNHRGMPLYLWVWTFILALVIVISLLLILEYRTKHLLKQVKRIRKFEEQNNTQNPRLDCYFLGSSLSYNALAKDKTFDAFSQERKLKINYEIAIIGSSGLDDFNPLINEIRNKRPRYLFIESNIACMNEVSNFRGRLVLIPQNFMKIVAEKFKLNNIFSVESQRSEDNSQLDFTPQKSPVDMANGVLFDVRKIDEFPEWNNFFREAADLGITIFLLELPRSLEAEKLMLSSVTEKYDQLVKDYYREFGIDYIAFPNKLSRDTYYIDRAHFNRLGSQYYCDWLTTQFCNRKLINCDEWISSH